MHKSACKVHTNSLNIFDVADCNELGNIQGKFNICSLIYTNIELKRRSPMAYLKENKN